MTRLESLIARAREMMPDATDDEIISEVVTVSGGDPSEVRRVVTGVPSPVEGDIIVVKYPPVEGKRQLRDVAIVTEIRDPTKIGIVTEWGESKKGNIGSVEIVGHSDEWLEAERSGEATSEFRDRMASEIWARI